MSARDMDYVDFCYVPQHHEAMHARLGNWARWVRVRPHGCQTHPMWRHSVTPRGWDIDPHISTALDTLDALLIERTVSQLPEKHRDALRWHYVRKADPAGMARRLGVSLAGLLELVCDGRAMVANRATVTK
jgi:DNA-directed RNA polymerase specialized sigma24 family protein